MKAITALNLLKKHGLIHKDTTLRTLKVMRRVIVGTHNSWEDFIRYVMRLEYLVGKKDLSEAIVIPEVQFGIGGTVKLRVQIAEEEAESD